MKAILTKTLNPTDTKGARIKAYDMDNNSVTVSRDHSLDEYENHLWAAASLLQKMNWDVYLSEGGAIRDGYAFVLFSQYIN